MASDTEGAVGTNGSGTAEARESLSVVDNRTGKSYELPITDGTIRSLDLPQDQGQRGRLRRSWRTTRRSRTPRRAARPSRSSTATRASSSTAATRSSSSPSSSTYLEVAYLLDPRRAADEAAAGQSGRTTITIHTFVHENVKSFMEGFRYDAHPMGMLLGSVGALSTFYPEANEIHDQENIGHPDDPPDRQDADARRVRLPPHRAACRTSTRTTTSTYAGQLPRDDLQDRRAEVPAGPAPGAGAGHPLHPARRPRAELLDERGARGRLLAGRPVLRHRRRRRRALRPAARRRQRGGAADAAPHRDGRERPGRSSRA